MNVLVAFFVFDRPRVTSPSCSSTSTRDEPGVISAAFAPFGRPTTGHLGYPGQVVGVIDGQRRVA